MLLWETCFRAEESLQWDGEAHAIGPGGAILGREAARWLPSVLEVRLVFGEPVIDRGYWTEYEIVTREREICRTGCLFWDRDPRPQSDELALLWSDTRNPSGQGHHRWDGTGAALLCWSWRDTERIVSLEGWPFRAACRRSAMSWEWSWRKFGGAVSQGDRYWEGTLLDVPAIEVRKAMREAGNSRLGVTQAQGKRFCRAPFCPYGANYPSAPEKEVWCHRHWTEAQGLPRHTYHTLPGIRGRNT